MKFRLISVLSLATLLSACTVQSQVQQPAVAPEQVKVESAEGVPAATSVTAGPTLVEQVVVKDSTADLSNRIDQLTGRLTLVQEQVINQNKMAQQQLEISQAILQRLQLLTQSSLLEQPKTDKAGNEPNAATLQQLDAATSQLLQIANEVQLSSTGSATGDWGIASVVTSKGWVLLRYKPKSGETWLAEKGAWSKLNDSSTLKAGSYDIQIVRRDTDSKGYVAVRINKQTGDTWWLNDRTWQAY